MSAALIFSSGAEKSCFGTIEGSRSDNKSATGDIVCPEIKYEDSVTSCHCCSVSRDVHKLSYLNLESSILAIRSGSMCFKKFAQSLPTFDASKVRNKVTVAPTIDTERPSVLSLTTVYDTLPPQEIEKTSLVDIETVIVDLKTVEDQSLAQNNDGVKELETVEVQSEELVPAPKVSEPEIQSIFVVEGNSEDKIDVQKCEGNLRKNNFRSNKPCPKSRKPKAASISSDKGGFIVLHIGDNQNFCYTCRRKDSSGSYSVLNFDSFDGFSQHMADKHNTLVVKIIEKPPHGLVGKGSGKLFARVKERIAAREMASLGVRSKSSMNNKKARQVTNNLKKHRSFTVVNKLMFPFRGTTKIKRHSFLKKRNIKKNFQNRKKFVRFKKVAKSKQKTIAPAIGENTEYLTNLENIVTIKNGLNEGAAEFVHQKTQTQNISTVMGELQAKDQSITNYQSSATLLENVEIISSPLHNVDILSTSEMDRSTGVDPSSTDFTCDQHPSECNKSPESLPFAVCSIQSKESGIPAILLAQDTITDSNTPKSSSLQSSRRSQRISQLNVPADPSVQVKKKRGRPPKIRCETTNRSDIIGNIRLENNSNLRAHHFIPFQDVAWTKRTCSVESPALSLEVDEGGCTVTKEQAEYAVTSIVNTVIETQIAANDKYKPGAFINNTENDSLNIRTSSNKQVKKSFPIKWTKPRQKKLVHTQPKNKKNDPPESSKTFQKFSNKIKPPDNESSGSFDSSQSSHAYNVSLILRRSRNQKRRALSESEFVASDTSTDSEYSPRLANKKQSPGPYRNTVMKNTNTNLVCRTQVQNSAHKEELLVVSSEKSTNEELVFSEILPLKTMPIIHLEHLLLPETTACTTAAEESAQQESDWEHFDPLMPKLETQDTTFGLETHECLSNCDCSQVHLVQNEKFYDDNTLHSGSTQRVKRKPGRPRKHFPVSSSPPIIEKEKKLYSYNKNDELISKQIRRRQLSDRFKEIRKRHRRKRISSSNANAVEPLIQNLIQNKLSKTKGVDTLKKAGKKRTPKNPAKTQINEIALLDTMKLEKPDVSDLTFYGNTEFDDEDIMDMDTGIISPKRGNPIFFAPKNQVQSQHLLIQGGHAVLKRGRGRPPKNKNAVKFQNVKYEPQQCSSGSNITFNTRGTQKRVCRIPNKFKT